MSKLLLPLFSLLLACTDEPEPGGDLTLSTGFGEVTVTGTSDGTSDDAACAGTWPTEPQHTMELQSSFYDLGVVADSTAVVIMIRYDANTFCSDNDDGLPAVVRGSWSAGAYEVLVGVPEGGSSGVAYELEVVESYSAH